MEEVEDAQISLCTDEPDVTDRFDLAPGYPDEGYFVDRHPPVP